MTVPVTTNTHHYRLRSKDGQTVTVGREEWALIQTGDPYVGRWR